MKKKVLILIFIIISLYINCSIQAEIKTIYVEPKGVYATIDTSKDGNIINILKNGTKNQKNIMVKHIVSHSDQYIPAVFFALSNTFWEIGDQDQAYFWFYAGRIRTHFDIKRCADKSVAGSVEMLSMSVPDELRISQFNNIEKVKNILRKVIEWDERTAYNYDHRWINLHGIDAMVYDLDKENKMSIPTLSIPEKEWESLAKQNRENYLQSSLKYLDEFQASLKKATQNNIFTTANAKESTFNYHFEQIGQLNISRDHHSTTLLDDGRVLIVGGYDAEAYGDTNISEFYLPKEKKFVFAPKSLKSRQYHQAIKLQDGRVLIVGGFSKGKKTDWQWQYLKECELFDPTKNCFEYTGTLNFIRQDHQLTLLQDGRVLVSGGGTSQPYIKRGEGLVFEKNFSYQNTAEIYDPKTGQFTVTPKMKEDRSLHTATLLPDGCVLIAGGTGKKIGARDPSDRIHNTTEIYDPTRNCFEYTGSMKFERKHHFAILLLDGRVLIAGGESFLKEVDDAEIYAPLEKKFVTLLKMNNPLINSLTLLDNGNVLIGNYDKISTWQLLYTKEKVFKFLNNNTRLPAFNIATKLPNNQILFTGSNGIMFLGPNALLFTYKEEN